MDDVNVPAAARLYDQFISDINIVAVNQSSHTDNDINTVAIEVTGHYPPTVIEDTSLIPENIQLRQRYPGVPEALVKGTVIETAVHSLLDDNEVETDQSIDRQNRENPIIAIVGNQSFPNGECTIRLSDLRRLTCDPNVSNEDKCMNDTLQHCFDNFKYQKISKRYKRFIIFMPWYFYSCIKSEGRSPTVILANYEVVMKGKTFTDLKNYFNSYLAFYDVFHNNHISCAGFINLKSLMERSFLPCEVINIYINYYYN